MIITLFVAFFWAVAGLLFDAIWTNRGLRAGIAVEGNAMIVFFARTNKPALWQLLTIDGALRLILLAIGFIPGPARYPHAFAAMMIGGFISFGLKNIMGGRQWKWMFAHPGSTLPWLNSAWDQFIGFWG